MESETKPKRKRRTKAEMLEVRKTDVISLDEAANVSEETFNNLEETKETVISAQPKDNPLWVETQMPDGTTYRVPVKVLSNSTDEKTILEDADKKTWFEVQQEAVIYDKVEVDGDIWQSVKKRVIYG